MKWNKFELIFRMSIPLMFIVLGGILFTKIYTPISTLTIEQVAGFSIMNFGFILMAYFLISKLYDKFKEKCESEKNEIK